MQTIDDTVLLWLAGLGHDVPGLGAVARILTELGGYGFLVPLVVVVSIGLCLNGHARRAAALLLVTFGGRLVVELTKTIIDRPRPAFVQHRVEVSSMSFPSGHAGNSTIVYLALAFIVGPLLTRTRWPIVSAAICAMLVGITRPILAVHWPTDVLAGWSLGLAWTLSMVWMLERWMTGQPVETGHPDEFNG